MTVESAVKLFSIADITIETRETLKAKYRKLMIKYHPDNMNGDDNKAKEIGLAYEVLQNIIKEISAYKALNQEKQLMIIVLPLTKMIDLYNGETVTIDGNVIDKRTAKRNNTLLVISADITHNGIVTSYSKIMPWNYQDKYEVHCDIFVDKLGKPEDITISVENKRMNIAMEAQSLRIKFTLTYNITVDVIINKKIKVEKNT